MCTKISVKKAPKTEDRLSIVEAKKNKKTSKTKLSKTKKKKITQRFPLKLSFQTRAREEKSNRRRMRFTASSNFQVTAGWTSRRTRRGRVWSDQPVGERVCGWAPSQPWMEVVTGALISQLGAFRNGKHVTRAIMSLQCLAFSAPPPSSLSAGWLKHGV